MRRIWILPLVLSLALIWAAPVLADTTYIVQPGDTLTRISAHFNVTIEAILRANNLSDPNTIRVGQTLVIPDGSPTTTPTPTTAQPGAPSTPATGGSIYIVQPGDSLYRLAARFNTTIDALVAANGLTSSTLHIGQQLIIPGTPAAGPTPDSVYNRIRGTATFVRRVREGLDWLQTNDAEAYHRVNAYITQIVASPYRRCAQAVPLGDGGCLVRALARAGQSTAMIAALLFHEATHCYQFATVGLLSSKEAEVQAYSEQIAFMERHNFPADEIEYYRKVLEYYTRQPDTGQYVPPPNF